MGFNATFNNMLVISLRSVFIMCYFDCELRFHLLLTKIGAVVAVVALYLDLPLPMQSVSITTDVVSLNLDQSEVYNIM
jgi:hypothetical protein